MLVGISTMLALRTGLEEFQISEDETNAFLKSAQNVARHYSIETTQKTLDWIAFIGMSGQVFGTRGVAIAMKIRNQRDRRQQKPGNVTQFPMAVDLSGASEEPGFAG